MTDYIELLDRTARQLNHTIKAMPGVVPMPTPEYGWENFRYSSPQFRMAHVEIFNQDRFMVVHTCVFPHIDDPAPIFGFDVIASHNKVTGVFLDLSPTVKDPGVFHVLKFKQQRERPEWGDIFSRNWIACRPDKEEMMLIISEALRLIKYHNTLLRQETSDVEAIRAGQNRYCTQQQQNEHTLRALKNLIGPDRAREFMETVLFPTV